MKNKNRMINGVLTDCMVLDISRLLPGALCACMLADHGARVVCIEDRIFEKRSFLTVAQLSRNKAHMSLSLRSEKGRAVFLEMVKTADVVICGFRPATAKRLNLEYETLKAFHPGLIHCSITGYGLSGSFCDRPGHDINFMAQSGALDLMQRGDFRIPGIALAAQAGALNAFSGTLLALLCRKKTGMGQQVEIALTDALAALLPLSDGWPEALGPAPLTAQGMVSPVFACYSIYRAADGRHLALAAIERAFWEKVCHYFKVPEYIDLQFDSKSRQELIDFFSARFVEKPSAHWLDVFEPLRVCLTRASSPAEVLTGDYFKERGLVRELNGRQVLRSAIRLSETPARLYAHYPEFGKDTHAILKTLGYGPEEIRKLEQEKVI